MKNVLVISPHPDDAELWCGATLWKMREKWKIQHIVLSGHRTARCEESEKANRALRIEPAIMGFRDTEFPSQESLLRQTIEVVAPDVVICPGATDLHQDHRTVYKICWQLFRGKSSILGFDIPYNAPTQQPQMFVEVSYQDMLKKIEAVMCHRSQAEKDYAKEANIFGLARLRGAQIGVQYAEAFEVIRWRL